MAVAAREPGRLAAVDIRLMGPIPDVPGGSKKKSEGVARIAVPPRCIGYFCGAYSVAFRFNR